MVLRISEAMCSLSPLRSKQLVKRREPAQQLQVCLTVQCAGVDDALAERLAQEGHGEFLLSEDGRDLRTRQQRITFLIRWVVGEACDLLRDLLCSFPLAKPRGNRSRQSETVERQRRVAARVCPD